jgi:hypothetical protein
VAILIANDKQLKLIVQTSLIGFSYRLRGICCLEALPASDRLSDLLPVISGRWSAEAGRDFVYFGAATAILTLCARMAGQFMPSGCPQPYSSPPATSPLGQRTLAGQILSYVRSST